MVHGGVVVVLAVMGIIGSMSMSVSASEVCVGSERACEQGTAAWEIPFSGPYEPLTVRVCVCVYKCERQKDGKKRHTRVMLGVFICSAFSPLFL